MSRTQENDENCCHQTSSFKIIIASNSISAAAPSQTPLGELTALPRPPSWNLGVLLLKEKKKGKGKRKAQERKGGEES